MSYFPGLTSLEILQKIQNDLRERNIEPEKFEDRIIFTSMFNDIEKFSFQIPNKSRITRRDSRKDTGCASGLETKWSGMELSVFSPEGKSDSTASQMVERLKETGRPVFKSISALSCGILKRKNNRHTIHFNADSSNTEL